MRYRCRQCEYVSNEPGNCPTCNIPMEILNEDEEQGQPEAAPAEAPEAAPETPDVTTTDDGAGDGGDSAGEGEEAV